MTELKNIIDKTQKIAIFCHENPDGDAIGSMLGLGRLLEKLGKDVFYFSPDKPSTTFSFLEGFEKIKTTFDYGYYHLLIFVDFSEYARIKTFYKGKENYFSENQILVFDHHQMLNPPENWTVIHDTQSTSTCEIILENTLNIREEYYDKEIATYLYLGLTTDSGNFRYDENHERILKNALTLIQLGADKKSIIDNVINNKSLGTINFLKTLLDRMSIEGEILYSYYDIDELKDYDIDNEQASYGLTILQEINGPKVIMTIRKEDHLVKVSLRSKDANVEEIAKSFGGGGHIHASGFAKRIEDGKDFYTTKNEVINKIKSLLK
ncbi:MAG TPA: bifunctional oligoribonuclease/PAP phosphatase NrnA, partial [Candidatus Absconditabacterales bacterium]|nr:bifunctional oligoribonuclease/PAP phosphatase NrnA [Candidatus Absconditabacterales bacterium]